MTKSRGINKPKAIWTDAMVEILRARYPHERTENIANDIGYTLQQTFGKAKSMGLAKTEKYLASPDACRLRRDNPKGESTRFKPGQVPPNKGKKMPDGWAPGNMAKTQFKSGGQPHTALPIGSYRHDKSGNLQRKINNDPGNNSVRWRCVHELVWTDKNGAVPDKHIVVFKAGMRTNVLEEITIDRVECISLADHMRRNTLHRYPKEIKEVIQMRAVLTRHINTRTKNEQPKNDQ